MQLLPGFGGGPSAPPPLPPPPTREDPAIAKARETQRTAELRRRGRRGAILTTGRGVEEPLGTVKRPQATALRQSELLGG